MVSFRKKHFLTLSLLKISTKHVMKPFIIQTHNHIFIIIFCFQIVLDSSQIFYLGFRLRIPEWEVFGGLIFNSCDRGQFFYDQPNIDSLPFSDNFPGVTLGGTFCSGEVGCGSVQESQEKKVGALLPACILCYPFDYVLPSRVKGVLY
ncbi:hypothetical protein Hanom_Chr17g01583121 [Helianthus anomalus]